MVLPQMQGWGVCTPVIGVGVVVEDKKSQISRFDE